MYILLISRGIPEPTSPQWGCFEYDQAKALAKAGHKVVVFSVDQRFNTHLNRLGIKRTEKNGVISYNYVVCPKVVSKLMGNKLQEQYLKNKWRKLYTTILEQEGEPDIIYAHYLFNIYRATNYLEIQKIPIVGIEHWSEIKRDNLPQNITDMAKCSYHRLSCLLSVSKATRKTIYNKFGIDSTVVYDMAGEEFFGTDICRSQSSNVTKYIAIGSLIKRKGYDILLQALKKAQLPSHNWTLDIIGNGEERQHIEQQIIELGLSANITLHGFKSKEEIKQMLCNSDVFVLPSRMETFGVVYIEALACGLPVIATPCGGPEEFINERNGILVKTEDADDLSRAIRYMQEHKGDYDRLAIAEDCKNNFSPEVISAKLTAIFEQLKKNQEHG